MPSLLRSHHLLFAHTIHCFLTLISKVYGISGDGDGEIVTRFTLPVRSVAINHDGSALAASGDADGIKIVSTKDYKVRDPFPFSPDMAERGMTCSLSLSPGTLFLRNAACFRYSGCCSLGRRCVTSCMTPRELSWPLSTAAAASRSARTLPPFQPLALSCLLMTSCRAPRTSAYCLHPARSGTLPKPRLYSRTRARRLPRTTCLRTGRGLAGTPTGASSLCPAPRSAASPPPSLPPPTHPSSLRHPRNCSGDTLLKDGIAVVHISTRCSPVPSPSVASLRPLSLLPFSPPPWFLLLCLLPLGRSTALPGQPSTQPLNCHCATERRRGLRAAQLGSRRELLRRPQQASELRGLLQQR